MLEDRKQKIYIGSDHAGYEEKNQLKVYLAEEGYDVIDLGCFDQGSCDYPDIAREVSEKVLENGETRGILVCGSGIGMSIAANRLRGIRAVLARNEQDAELGRRHNDVNILAMGARVTDFELEKKIVDKFMNTQFEGDLPEGERHKRRVEKMDNA